MRRRRAFLDCSSNYSRLGCRPRPFAAHHFCRSRFCPALTHHNPESLAIVLRINDRAKIVQTVKQLAVVNLVRTADLRNRWRRAIAIQCTRKQFGNSRILATQRHEYCLSEKQVIISSYDFFSLAKKEGLYERKRARELVAKSVVCGKSTVDRVMQHHRAAAAGVSEVNRAILRHFGL